MFPAVGSGGMGKKIRGGGGIFRPNASIKKKKKLRDKKNSKGKGVFYFSETLVDVEANHHYLKKQGTSST